MYGACLCCYICSRTNSTKLQLFAYQNSRKSLKNLSGDIWMLLKTELAFVLVAAVLQRGYTGGKKLYNPPEDLLSSHAFFFFFSALWKNNTHQERSKLWMDAKLLGTIWNEEFLSLWDLDFSHLPAALPPFPCPSEQHEGSRERKKPWWLGP